MLLYPGSIPASVARIQKCGRPPSNEASTRICIRSVAARHRMELASAWLKATSTGIDSKHQLSMAQSNIKRNWFIYHVLMQRRMASRKSRGKDLARERSTCRGCLLGNHERL